MRRIGPLLACVLLLSGGCAGRQDFVSPTDGSQQVAQGTSATIGDVAVGVGSLLKDPPRALLSVRRDGQPGDSHSVTLGVGERATVQDRTVIVSAIEDTDDHDYVWIKVER